MSLDQFTDQQLQDELLNRRLEREQVDEPKDYCDECQHFKCWTKRSDPPDSYNPCSHGHAMRFHFPEGWEDPHSGGYFRRICSDRLPVEPPPPPAPEVPPEPPRGQPDWKPSTVAGGRA